jgi:hypothetical protein
VRNSEHSLDSRQTGKCKYGRTLSPQLDLNEYGLHAFSSGSGVTFLLDAGVLFHSP